MSKTILFIAGGIETIPGILKAKEMGLWVVVSDGNPNAPGFEFADDRVIVDTYDINATVKAAKDYHRNTRNIDGVICMASDVPVTVATVANTFNLPGIPLESAFLSANKLAMKDKFKEDGVPIPWYSKVESTAHLQEIAEAQGYPLVLKPADSRGARGVLILSPGFDLKWAFEIALHNSPSNTIMVEQFLPGPQVSTETIVIEGHAYTIGFSDRNYEFLEKYAPHVIENGGELPSILPLATQKKVKELVQKASESMGVINGIIKGDIVIFNNEPHIIEVATRLSGGYFCSHEIPLNTGIDFVKLAIDLSLGKKLNPEQFIPIQNNYVVQRYIFPKPGRIVEISGIEEISKKPEIALCEVRCHVGDIIEPIDSHPARAGLVIAIGNSREQAIDNAVKAINGIKIITRSIN